MDQIGYNGPIVSAPPNFTLIQSLIQRNILFFPVSFKNRRQL